jgi:hypothetical protein
MVANGAGAAAIEHVLARLDDALAVNMPRTAKAKEAARFILEREARGERLEQFVWWVMSNEFERRRVHEFATWPDRIQRWWPRAFKSSPYEPKSSHLLRA